MDELAKVKPDKMGFGELMLNIQNGKIRIPDFQREFVWELSQIISLLDSIYHHYPIGSFLFWETDDDIQAYRRVGEVELRHDQERAVQYVLDGQQRLTSLFASLEQASIAHRVNGKKVTKSIQVYFDLDEGQFVANPFNRKDEKSVYKRVTFASFPRPGDYLAFLSQFLEWIEEESPTRKENLTWLRTWPDMALSRARTIHAQTREMGLFVETDDGCVLTDLGKAQIGSRSPETLLELLRNKIEYFDILIPKVLEDGKAELTELADFLSESVGEEIKPYKARSRLRWLAGLGLGSFDDVDFGLSEDGRVVLADFYREIEIRERDRLEQEAEKRKRLLLRRTNYQIFDKFVETCQRI